MPWTPTTALVLKEEKKKRSRPFKVYITINMVQLLDD